MFLGLLVNGFINSLSVGIVFVMFKLFVEWYGKVLLVGVIVGVLN